MYLYSANRLLCIICLRKPTIMYVFTQTNYYVSFVYAKRLLCMFLHKPAIMYFFLHKPAIMYFSTQTNYYVLIIILCEIQYDYYVIGTSFLHTYIRFGSE